MIILSRFSLPFVFPCNKTIFVVGSRTPLNRVAMLFVQSYVKVSNVILKGNTSLGLVLYVCDPKSHKLQNMYKLFWILL